MAWACMSNSTQRAGHGQRRPAARAPDHQQLLNNALKFTGQGQISLLARREPDGDTVRVEVGDTGPGIDATTCARLFEPFTQADQSTTRRFGGTGLGLSICRQLASLMGGSVGVHSEIGSAAPSGPCCRCHAQRNHCPAAWHGQRGRPPAKARCRVHAC
jgi:hypothetical protein